MVQVTFYNIWYFCMTSHIMVLLKSYYNSSSVCLFVCLCVPYLLRGPLTDLRQTWWVYLGGPPICPWGVLFQKGQRLDGSTGHFHFPLYYYICTSLMPHSCKGAFCLLAQLQSLIRRLLLLHLNIYVGGPCNYYWELLFLKSQRVNGSLSLSLYYIW